MNTAVFPSLFGNVFFFAVFQQAVFLLNVARGTKKSPPGAANLAGGRFLKRPVFDHGGIHDVGKHD